MKKICYFSNEFENKPFDLSDPSLNRDNCRYSYFLLKKEFEKYGYDLSTNTIVPGMEDKYNELQQYAKLNGITEAEARGKALDIITNDINLRIKSEALDLATEKYENRTVKKTNDSLKSVPCPFCGRFSLSYWAYYVRAPRITSNVAEGYVCSYWRCKAKGMSLSAMQQNIGVFVRMLNKIFRLK
jgi:hypothetical protein